MTDKLHEWLLMAIADWKCNKSDINYTTWQEAFNNVVLQIILKPFPTCSTRGIKIHPQATFCWRATANGKNKAIFFELDGWNLNEAPPWSSFPGPFSPSVRAPVLTQALSLVFFLPSHPAAAEGTHQESFYLCKNFNCILSEGFLMNQR